MLGCICLWFSLRVALSSGTIDFDFLPPLLRFDNRTQVSTPEAWFDTRRSQVATLLENHILGALPSTPCPIVKAIIINQTSFRSRGSKSTATWFRLEFNAADTYVSYEIEVLAPPVVAGRHFPLFLTQPNHREWALLALSRGYMSVVYPGGDTRDAAPLFQQAFKDEASMMLIMARAYVVSRTLDFLLSGSELIPPINDSQVGLTGHSRNGKQSLVAAAFDSRITAVVGSSPGAPIAAPYYFSSHNYDGEGPYARTAGTWWLNSTLQYIAHPEKLPMDGHGVLGMIAPRACAVANAWTDATGEVSFADEMGMVEAAKVYELLNASNRLAMIHRPGSHHGFIDVNIYLDFFDIHFGRLPAGNTFPLSWASPVPGNDIFSRTYYTPAGFDWALWNDTYGHSTPAPPTSSTPLLERMEWLLQMDTTFGISLGSTYAEEGVHPNPYKYTSVMMRHHVDTRNGRIKRLPISFGGYITGNVYYPSSAQQGNEGDKRLPAMIWLHPYSYSTGYAPSYGNSRIPEDMAEAGFVVLAYDQVGFASRVREGGSTFYARHGNTASLLGRAVSDARAALDLLHCLTAARATPECYDHEIHVSPYRSHLDHLPEVDPNRIVVAGYSFGATVALHVGAVDSRVSAVASFSGFTPMRTDTNDKPTGGIRRLYELHAILPRLGMFATNPAEIPYDYAELIATLAPRPVLVYTPQEDRDATYSDVERCILKARRAWSIRPEAFTHLAPDTHTSMGPVQSLALHKWAKDQHLLNHTSIHPSQLKHRRRRSRLDSHTKLKGVRGHAHPGFNHRDP